MTGTPAPDHEHRHIHLPSGHFWWHRHQHECTGSDFNALHHHPPAGHDVAMDDDWTVDGTYADNLDDRGWRLA
jgi:hypothetical protein